MQSPQAMPSSSSLGMLQRQQQLSELLLLGQQQQNRFIALMGL